MVNEQIVKLKTEYRRCSARQEVLQQLERIFLNNIASDLCNTLQNIFSGITSESSQTGGGGYIGETARLHYPFFFRSVDVHRCAPF